MSPLNPPQWFRKTRGIHRIGLAVNRPAAGNVLVGTLYFSADTSVLERSNGSIWETYSGSGGGGSIGPIGPPGIDGIDGLDGLDGISGMRGIDGLQGINGLNGLNGIPGLDGEDGGDSLINIPSVSNNVYGASCFKSSNQTLTSGVDSPITFDSEVFDLGGLHSTSSNTARFTVGPGEAGAFLFSGAILYAASATGQRQLKVRKNGTDFLRGYADNPDPGVTYNRPISLTIIAPLLDNEYAEFIAMQTSGGNLDIFGDATAYYAAVGTVWRLGRI